MGVTNGCSVDLSHRKGLTGAHRMMSRGGVRVLPIWSACLSIAVGACGEDGTAPVDPAEPDTVISSIRVSPSERTIGVLGTQIEVGATALNEDGEMLYGSTLDPGRFSWSTSASDVATVDEETHPITGRSVRLVTGVSEGTATITATSQGATGVMTVTVRDRARLAWSVPVGTGSISAGIAIGADGTIYVVSSEYGSTSHLFALSPQGSVVWTLDTPFRVFSTPAIGADGTLYLGSMSTNTFTGRLIAVDPGGTVRWVLADIDGIRSSPALGPDGTIYVAGGYHVYAVDPEGEIRWAYESTDDVFVFSSPAVASYGTIYVGGADANLYAINPDGSPRWTFATGGLIDSSPSIGMDGTIYFGSLDGRLYAVNPDGTERWSVELDWRGVSSSPSIGPDGTIYVVAGAVFAVDPGGSIRWNYRPGGWTSTPILGAAGTVYVTSGAPRGSVVYALDARGRLQWDYPTGRHNLGSPAIGVHGTIISASFSGSSSAGYEATIHAIVENGSTNGGYAGAPWPTARGNRANTGRVGG